MDSTSFQSSTKKADFEHRDNRSEALEDRDDKNRLKMSQVSPEEERKLRWKFDLNLIFPLAFMFVFYYHQYIAVA